MSTQAPARRRIWKWIRHGDQTLRDIGTEADGTLHNPNGYDPTTVHAAIAAAEQRMHQARSEAARKAAVTRRERTEKRVYEAVRRIIASNPVGPRSHCYVCGRGLGDPQSIDRSIGSECWQDVLDGIAHSRLAGAVSPASRARCP